MIEKTMRSSPNLASGRCGPDRQDRRVQVPPGRGESLDDLCPRPLPTAVRPPNARWACVPLTCSSWAVCSAPGQYLEMERRRQNLRRHVPRLFERADGQRRPCGHRERLPANATRMIRSTRLMTTGAHHPMNRRRGGTPMARCTYATNNELAFDYLRDNSKPRLDAMVQRPQPLRDCR